MSDASPITEAVATPAPVAPADDTAAKLAALSLAHDALVADDTAAKLAALSLAHDALVAEMADLKQQLRAIMRLR